MKTKYKFIEFLEPADKLIQNRWYCHNIKHGDLLGYTAWCPEWKQHIFFSEPDIQFSAGCLADITHFLTQITKAARTKPLTDQDRMPFGKYQDAMMKDVPAEYLTWCMDQHWFSTKYPAVYDYIDANWDQIQKEELEKAKEKS